MKSTQRHREHRGSESGTTVQIWTKTCCYSLVRLPNSRHIHVNKNRRWVKARMGRLKTEAKANPAEMQHLHHFEKQEAEHLFTSLHMFLLLHVCANPFQWTRPNLLCPFKVSYNSHEYTRKPNYIYLPHLVDFLFIVFLLKPVAGFWNERGLWPGHYQLVSLLYF